MYPAAMWAFDFHWPQRAGDDEVALDVTQRLAEVGRAERIARHSQGTVGIDPDRPCARALQLPIGEIAEILTRLDLAMSSFEPRLKMDRTLGSSTLKCQLALT